MSKTRHFAGVCTLSANGGPLGPNELRAEGCSAEAAARSPRLHGDGLSAAGFSEAELRAAGFSM